MAGTIYTTELNTGREKIVARMYSAEAEVRQIELCRYEVAFIATFPYGSTAPFRVPWPPHLEVL
jgi:hypothetical protein